jgi:protein gp37
MAKTPRHVYQVLTKRPERMRDVVNQIRGHFPDRLDHVWHGVSAENQPMYDKRVALLLQTRSRIHFLSMEPLLGHVDLRLDTQDGLFGPLNWVIVGAESGPRVRPTKPEWVQSIRDQCVDAGVAFFFKQWGGATPKAGGRVLDGRTWDELPA